MYKSDYLLTASEIQKKYGLEDLEQGLSKQTAAQRLKENGPNKLKSERTPKWKLLIRQFNNMIIYILLLSALLTFLWDITQTL